MSELGDALELLHIAATRIRTLTGTLVEWYDEERGARAVDAFAERHRDGGVAVLHSHAHGEPTFRQYELRTVVHYSAPDRYRLVQKTDDYAHRPNDILMVSDGQREWTYDAAERDACVQAPSHQQLLDLVDPSWLTAACVLSVAGHATYGGRAAIEMRARVRQGSTQFLYHDLSRGMLADEQRAVVDAGTGLLLSLSSHFDEAPYQVKRLTDVNINRSLDDELFRFAPPEGVPVRDLEAHAAHPGMMRTRARFHLYRMRRRLRRGE